MVISIIFGRAFCGIICPFGTLQQLFGRLGRSILGKKLQVHGTIDRKLRTFKYLVLIISVLMAWKTYTLWIIPYDPWNAYAHLSAGKELIKESPVGFTLLILVLLSSIFYERVFCKYLCPMGAFLAITSKLSRTNITRNEHKCIDCKKCDKFCPVNIQVSTCNKITSSECINCGECILECAKPGALEINTFNKKVSFLKYMLITLLFFFGLVVATKFMGLYKDLPKKIGKGEITSQQQLSDIKGYMTLKEVSEITGVSLDRIYKKAGFTKEQVPENTKCKEIGKVLNSSFETENLREIVKDVIKENK